MTRIIHRSKIYAREYYLSCLIFGILFGWGESIILWSLLPYSIETSELISLNLTAALFGGFTSLATSVIAIFAYKLWKRKEEFDRDIHQTAWVFAFAFALFFLFMAIGGLFHLRTMYSIIFGIPFSAGIFVILYTFSKSVLFKHSRAIRFTVEFVIVFFLLLYLLKHPGFRREIPTTPPIRPHIFIFDIDNLPISENNLPLSAVLPPAIVENLNAYPISFASDLANRYNYRDILQVYSEDSTFQLSEMLSYYGYHQALFSPSVPPPEITIKQFSFRDVQNSSLQSRLSLVGFYDKIIPFIDLKDEFNRSEGYALNKQRDPILLSNRIIRYLSRKRDGAPFFMLIKFSELSLTKSASESPANTGIKNLFAYLLKNDFNNNALFVFTSLSGDKPRRPIYIYTGGLSVVLETPDRPHSQRDITLTAASLALKKELKGKFARTFIEAAPSSRTRLSLYIHIKMT